MDLNTTLALPLKLLAFFLLFHLVAEKLGFTTSRSELLSHQTQLSQKRYASLSARRQQRLSLSSQPTTSSQPATSAPASSSSSAPPRTKRRPKLLEIPLDKMERMVEYAEGKGGARTHRHTHRHPRTPTLSQFTRR